MIFQNNISYLSIIFIFGCAGSSLLLFSSSDQQGALCSSRAQAYRCGGLSRCRAWALWASVVAAAVHGLSNCSFRALEHRLNICGTPVELLHSMWDLPESRMEPVSHVIAGRFFTSEPRGKTSKWFCFVLFWLHHMAFGILVPWLGIEPGSLAVKVASPNHYQGIPHPRVILKTPGLRQPNFDTELVVLSANSILGSGRETAIWSTSSICVYSSSQVVTA